MMHNDPVQVSQGAGHPVPVGVGWSPQLKQSDESMERQSDAQCKVPESKAVRVLHVCPLKSVESQTSGPSMVPLPHR
jgi:hypothetical protein